MLAWTTISAGLQMSHLLADHWQGYVRKDISRTPSNRHILEPCGDLAQNLGSLL
jgi:hypothetical protein